MSRTRRMLEEKEETVANDYVQKTGRKEIKIIREFRRKQASQT